MKSRPALGAQGADSSRATPVEVSVVDEQTEHRLDIDRWMGLCADVLGAEQVGVGALEGVEMTLLFVDEPTISALNERFMGKVGPTDVLSFPIDEEAAEIGHGGPSSFDEDGAPILDEFAIDPRLDDDRFRERGNDLDAAPLLLGDIVVCPSYAARHAAEHAGELHDGSLDAEIALLIVHGILHLLGMDHMVEAEAELMEARERDHLRRHYSSTVGR
jgi:probable rRNA maturation factor